MIDREAVLAAFQSFDITDFDPMDIIIALIHLRDHTAEKSVAFEHLTSPQREQRTDKQRMDTIDFLLDQIETCQRREHPEAEEWADEMFGIAERELAFK